jgi:hypothetical protein
MKRFACMSAITLALTAVVLGLSRGKAAAQGRRDTPPAKLSGSYSVKGTGVEDICFRSGSGAAVDCSSSGASVLPITVLFVGQNTRDVNGNQCSTFTQVLSGLPALSSLDPSDTGVHLVLRTVSYNPATGTGDTVGGIFDGGRCSGTTFFTDGATQLGSVHTHFAASKGGDVIESIVTVATLFPPGTTNGNILQDYSLSITERAQ